LIIAACLGLFAYHGIPRLLPIPEGLRHPPAPGAEITDRSGRPLRRLLADGQRVHSLSIADVPQELIDATVSAEDKRFWSHGGIDSIGLVRATLDSLVARRRVSGASTITQQLVKVAGDRYTNRTWKDKVREMAYARKLEISWTKERILSEYLQRVNYGNQSIGCAAASSLYFKKPLADLSLAECAFLAGLPQAPTRLNPYRNFDGAKKRQEWILSRMAEDGRLTREQAKRAAAEPLRLRRWTGGFEAPHFVEMLLAGADFTPMTPEDQAETEDATSGRRLAPIRTTLDLELQHFCERTVAARLAQLRPERVNEAAVVVIDNRTGGLRALLGSPDFFKAESGQVNGAMATRSAGSTLKPFTYLIALSQGDTPATIVDDLPTEFMTPTGLYSPKNYDRRHYGPMSYREALANSLNLSAVRVLERIGGAEVLHGVLTSLGMTTLGKGPDHYGLGLTIGNAEVRLLELANAYACLARLGEWRPVVLRADEEPRTSSAGIQKCDPASCWLIADILADPQARSRCFGLASPLRLAFPAAVKTGTSTDFRDNWCLGFTTDFTVGVWVGNFDHQPMNRVSGVSGAAPIWRDVMNWLEHRHGATWPMQPDTVVEVEVDPLTGASIPPEWRDRRPPVRERCAIDHRPAAGSPDHYDALGRVLLPIEYARWLRSADNWLGTDQVAVGKGVRAERTARLSITSPLPGATLILDPDLPQGGGRLPLRANTVLQEPEWSSSTLRIEAQGARAFALLTPGEHEIKLHDPSSGAEAVSRFKVRSL